MNIRGLVDKFLHTPILVILLYFIAFCNLVLAVVLFFAKQEDNKVWICAYIFYLWGSKESLEARINRLENK